MLENPCFVNRISCDAALHKLAGHGTLQTNKSSPFGGVRRGSLVDVASVGDEAGCPRSQALLGADVLGSRRGVAGIPPGHHMHRKSDLDDAVENPSPSPVVQPNDEDPAEWLDAKLLATEQYAAVEESYLETSIPGTTADGASVLDEPLDRRSLHEIIATTNSSAEAWDAYEMLLSLPRDGAGVGPPIPFRYMHRLAHLLVATEPRTRALFLRLLSVLSHLHQWGGRVRLWQWNALIDCAGKGWRKTRVEDFKSALDVYHDMISRSAPGSAFSQNEFAQSSNEQSAVDEFAEPDIFTYTTLVNIAGRTLNQATLRHATTMLNASGLSPNRITHLSLIRYFTRTRQLSGVRATLSKMKEQGFEIGLDGFNACIWAYGRNGRLEVASTIYRVLRHNLLPETNTGKDDINAAIEYLYASEDITIPETLTPNAVTYYTLIQCFAYHGDLTRCLEVFMQLISAPKDTLTRHDHDPPELDIASPTLPAFRAIFLGFARHARPPLPAGDHHLLTTRLRSTAWTADNLQQLFTSFLRLPHIARPSDRTVYWILVAFSLTSGHDRKKLCRVWEQLVEKFGGKWGGRVERFRNKIYDAVYDEAFFDKLKSRH